MTAPAVSVLMPVFNGEEYIAEAIRSILDQTWQDLELIVISEHGTSPASLAAVDAFDDSRIVHLRNEERLGLIASLNRGISLARGGLIARMDSDDVSLPERIAIQAAFMKDHPEVGVAGTLVCYMDASGQRTYQPRLFWRRMTVAWNMLFTSPIAHPSAMMRRELLLRLGGYDPRAHLVEDYDLWTRAGRNSVVMNVPEELVLLRKHGENITMAQRMEQGQASSSISRGELSRLLRKEVDPKLAYFLWAPREMRKKEDALAVAGLLNEAYREFVRLRSPSAESLKEIRQDLTRRYSVLLAASSSKGWRIAIKVLKRAEEGAELSRTAIIAQSAVRKALSRY